MAIGMPVWAPDGQYHHEQVLPSGEVATHVERVADGRVSEWKWTVEPGEVALVQRGRPRLLGSSVVSFDDARRTSMRVHDVLQGLPPWDDTNPDFWTAASLADLDLVMLLARSLPAAETAARGRKRAAEATEACAALTERILATYRDALARGASPRERASLVENLDALLALLEGGPPVLGDRLRRIRDAI